MEHATHSYARMTFLSVCPEQLPTVYACSGPDAGRCRRTELSSAGKGSGVVRALQEAVKTRRQPKP